MTRPVQLPQIAADLVGADRVVVVPGFGLAAARAEQPLLMLDEVLRGHAVVVDYAVHPLAGRFPGQLNTLLAGIGRARQHAPGDIDLAEADLVFAVGANDVVNPRASADPDSPLFGLGAFDVTVAGRVVVLKRSLGPGFAGVDNPLLQDPGTTLLLGEAKRTLTGLLAPALGVGPQA